MKTRTTILSVSIAACLFWLAGATASGQQPAAETGTKPRMPSAWVPVRSYDFGKVYRGEVLRHVFLIKNVGTDDLIITDLVPT